ncbi:MAG: pyruvate dehydrogenase (acetyl-transferring), homodimeric type [Gammaproteobacteria bacterium]|nr:pyruvate dehydrogenase (acetyl-transferring), homodimeric type [Gammaproteobacteria bacterium]
MSDKRIDSDPIETSEWLEALTAVTEFAGHERAGFILEQLSASAAALGIAPSAEHGIAATPHRNTLVSDIDYPGDMELEQRIDAINRWNVVIMVLRAAAIADSLGGHISTACSISRLYEVGFNHHFRAADDTFAGDLIFFQGHATEINYARGLLEGRFNEEQLNHFRQEVDGKGISSYPHPWLMPDYWQFATVSMGLGILQAIYQAHFMKYLQNRELIARDDRHVWYFSGDGEMDEPESRGALAYAARQQLDNLTLIINCNLQRLDGPVFSNGSIVNELECLFLGCGWRVIKVIHGQKWDNIFQRDSEGLIQARVSGMPDGEAQNYGAKDGAYIRENFFNSEALRALVSDISDEELSTLFRDGLGGHDFSKIHSAYVAARATKDKPTVILAHTVKGFGLGQAAEAQNIAHNAKKVKLDELKVIRERLQIPLTDEDLAQLPFYLPASDSAEVTYIKERRAALGGLLPQRRQQSSRAVEIPPLETFAPLLKSSGDRKISSTMAFARVLNILIKDKMLGKYVVPIIPDECRTFGLEGMFRQYGIYSPLGQTYKPVDHEQLMYYREAKDGQIIEEGINEAGAMCAWMAASTSYSHHDLPMIPFYVYYSMFGFQRVGDFAWASSDMRARGFLIGGTAGRTTLSGEGLQHNDGHSHVLSSVIPNCISYDPTYAYEVAVIIREGLRRMMVEQEDIYYYLTVTNESYSHPEMPQGIEEGIIKGMYLLRGSRSKYHGGVQLLGSGTILREVVKAAEELEKVYGVNADVWSVTSFTELRRQGLAVRRQNMLHPLRKIEKSYVENCLSARKGPVIAASDYIRTYADQIREWVPGDYVTLGTDGFGRSDTREKLREFHEVDHRFIVIAALKALADQGKMAAAKVAAAMKDYGIHGSKPDPATV